ncbi:MAG: hypothetical protein AAGK33_05655 [Pseudomonadota bacterium]
MFVFALLLGTLLSWFIFDALFAARAKNNAIQQGLERVHDILTGGRLLVLVFVVALPVVIGAALALVLSRAMVLPASIHVQLMDGPTLALLGNFLAGAIIGLLIALLRVLTRYAPVQVAKTAPWLSRWITGTALLLAAMVAGVGLINLTSGDPLRLAERFGSIAALNTPIGGVEFRAGLTDSGALRPVSTGGAEVQPADNPTLPALLVLAEMQSQMLFENAEVKRLKLARGMSEAQRPLLDVPPSIITLFANIVTPVFRCAYALENRTRSLRSGARSELVALRKDFAALGGAARQLTRAPSSEDHLENLRREFGSLFGSLYDFIMVLDALQRSSGATYGSVDQNNSPCGKVSSYASLGNNTGGKGQPTFKEVRDGFANFFMEPFIDNEDKFIAAPFVQIVGQQHFPIILAALDASIGELEASVQGLDNWHRGIEQFLNDPTTNETLIPIIARRSGQVRSELISYLKALMKRQPFYRVVAAQEIREQLDEFSRSGTPISLSTAVNVKKNHCVFPDERTPLEEILPAQRGGFLDLVSDLLEVSAHSTVLDADNTNGLVETANNVIHMLAACKSELPARGTELTLAKNAGLFLYTAGVQHGVSSRKREKWHKTAKVAFAHCLNRQNPATERRRRSIMRDTKSHLGLRAQAAGRNIVEVCRQWHNRLES